MKGPANQHEQEKNPKPRLFCFWHITGVGCNLCFTCYLASLFLRIKTNRKRQIQLPELIAPVATPLPLAVTHSSPGVQEHKHHWVRAQSSAHHQSTPRRGKSHPIPTVGTWAKPRSCHKGRV